MRKKYIKDLVIKIITPLVADSRIKMLENENIFLPLDERGFGLNSLDRLKLLFEIEKRMQVDFPEEYWGDKTFKNLAEIIDYLHQFQDFSK